MPACGFESSKVQKDEKRSSDDIRAMFALGARVITLDTRACNPSTGRSLTFISAKEATQY